MGGFKIDEVMTGYHYFTNDERGLKRKMEFRATWGPEDIKSFLTPQPDKFMRAPLYGDVTIEGLCDKAPIEGTIELDYFGRGTITYEFVFKANDVWYLYQGEKVNIKPWNVLTSHTTCVGSLYDGKGFNVSNSVTFFKLSSMFSFLASLRIV